MTPRVTFRLGLLCGSIISLALMGLHSDWLGKEGYAQYVQDHWTSSKITVPIQIVGIIIAIVGAVIVSWYTSPRRQELLAARAAAAQTANPGRWGFGCKGVKSNRTVALRFSNKEAKKGIEFEMDAPMARRVAQTIGEEADYCEAPETDGQPRQTSWAKLDAVDLDDGSKNLSRSKET